MSTRSLQVAWSRCIWAASWTISVARLRPPRTACWVVMSSSRFSPLAQLSRSETAEPGLVASVARVGEAGGPVRISPARRSPVATLAAAMRSSTRRAAWSTHSSNRAVSLAELSGAAPPRAEPTEPRREWPSSIRGVVPPVRRWPNFKAGKPGVPTDTFRSVKVPDSPMLLQLPATPFPPGVLCGASRASAAAPAAMPTEEHPEGRNRSFSCRSFSRLNASTARFSAWMWSFTSRAKRCRRMGVV
mmetsp:Transcript_83584/g.258468  ORF Transcript_83584/g.258468 Transcript_83584/m.258468 type:complete len:245 (+) Transcript_83584:994-1728(+)